MWRRTFYFFRVLLIFCLTSIPSSYDFDRFWGNTFLQCYDYSNNGQRLFPKFYNLFVDHEDPRLLLEAGPHFANIVLILGMAVERYILVVYATEAESLLSKRRRVVFIIFMTILLAVPLVVFTIDLFWPEFFSREALSPMKVSSFLDWFLHHVSTKPQTSDGTDKALIAIKNYQKDEKTDSKFLSFQLETNYNRITVYRNGRPKMKRVFSGSVFHWNVSKYLIRITIITITEITF